MEPLLCTAGSFKLTYNLLQGLQSQALYQFLHMPNLRRVGISLFFFLYTMPTYGQWTSDAFGLFDPATEPERQAWAGLQGERYIQGPEPPTSLQILMGEKSLIAGRGRSMALALGLDTHGNLMANGLITEFQLSSEDRTFQTESDNGLAYIIIPNTTLAGLFWASALIKNNSPLQSERQLYRITADMRQVVPRIEGSRIGDVRADLVSPPLRDVHDNLIDDGQGFLFQLKRHGKTDLIPALSVSALVQAQIPKDQLDREQFLRLSTNFEQTDAKVLAYAKPRLLSPIALTTQYNADLGLLNVKWAPLLTDDGHLVPDGSRVKLRLETKLFDPADTTAWVEAGMARASLFLWKEDFPARLTLATSFGAEVYEVNP